MMALRTRGYFTEHLTDLTGVRQPMLPVEQIWYAPRHRRDFGDVASLAASIEARGLLHPIVVKPDGELVAGERRLRACRDVLGWKEVPIRVVDVDSLVLGELEENTERKGFLPSEIDSIRRAVAAAAPRQGRADGRFQAAGGKVDGNVARFTGVGARSVNKIKAVMEAAERDPERFGHLVAEMDRRGKVDGAYRKLTRAVDQDRVLGLMPVSGRFKTLVVDPPWPSDWLSDQLGPDYATMSVPDILALDVQGWADDNAHCYLWTPNNYMPVAVQAMKAYGFEHKAILTWVKPRWGMGQYFRNQTEHVLFGVRGELATRSQAIATCFEAPIGAHSEKPQAFYDLVQAASYPPYGEAFQRLERPAFTNLFRPIAELPEAAE